MWWYSLESKGLNGVLQQKWWCDLARPVKLLGFSPSPSHSPSAMATPLLLRGIPHLRLRFRPHQRTLSIGLITSVLGRPSFSTETTTTIKPQDDNVTTTSGGLDNTATIYRATSDAAKVSSLRQEKSLNNRLWKYRKAEILESIYSITNRAKDILHSERYMDGELLSSEDEKTVVEKLLNFHPHLEDKIGCGLDAIMVDRHPEFRNSRCLFVVRTDGGWIDFSYQKCIRAYVRTKYPQYAERFFREYYNRRSR